MVHYVSPLGSPEISPRLQAVYSFNPSEVREMQTKKQYGQLLFDSSLFWRLFCMLSTSRFKASSIRGKLILRLNGKDFNGLQQSIDKIREVFIDALYKSGSAEIPLFYLQRDFRIGKDFVRNSLSLLDFERTIKPCLQRLGESVGAEVKLRTAAFDLGSLNDQIAKRYNRMIEVSMMSINWERNITLFDRFRVYQEKEALTSLSLIEALGGVDRVKEFPILTAKISRTMKVEEFTHPLMRGKDFDFFSIRYKVTENSRTLLCVGLFFKSVFMDSLGKHDIDTWFYWNIRKADVLNYFDSISIQPCHSLSDRGVVEVTCDRIRRLIKANPVGVFVADANRELDYKVESRERMLEDGRSVIQLI